MVAAAADAKSVFEADIYQEVGVKRESVKNGGLGLTRWFASVVRWLVRVLGLR